MSARAKPGLACDVDSLHARELRQRVDDLRDLRRGRRHRGRRSPSRRDRDRCFEAECGKRGGCDGARSLNLRDGGVEVAVRTRKTVTEIGAAAVVVVGDVVVARSCVMPWWSSSPEPPQPAGSRRARRSSVRACSSASSLAGSADDQDQRSRSLALGVALLVPGAAQCCAAGAGVVPCLGLGQRLQRRNLRGDDDRRPRAGSRLPLGNVERHLSDPRYGDIAAVAGTWTSPSFSPGPRIQRARVLVERRHAAGTWLQVEVRGVIGKGSHDEVVRARPLGLRRGHDPAYVGRRSGRCRRLSSRSTRFFTKDHLLTSYQLRVTLYRTPTTTRSRGCGSSVRSPRMRRTRSRRSRRRSGEPRGSRSRCRQYSQEIHAGQYPEYDGGGEAWCSPTSTSMVLAYWGALPPPSEWSWVDPSYADPWVD